MRVPEFADPIRVRWYKVPTPPGGVYTLTDYSSSNWDGDPKDYDPDLGEQSSTRQPFTDWRECTRPPWTLDVTLAGFPLYTIALTETVDYRPYNKHEVLQPHPDSSIQWTALVWAVGTIATVIPFPIVHEAPTRLDASQSARKLTVTLLVTAGPTAGEYETWTLYQGPTAPVLGDVTHAPSFRGPQMCTVLGFGPKETDVPLIGSIIWDAGVDAVPPQYLLADGSAVSRATYSLLFGRLGTAYGPGDGSTTFNLPNLIDRSAYGSGGEFATGATGGERSHTLVTAEIPAHTHVVNDPGHQHVPGDLPEAFVTSNSGLGDGIVPGAAFNVRFFPNTNNAVTGITNNNAGGGGAHNNLHPVLALRPLIFAGV